MCLFTYVYNHMWSNRNCITASLSFIVILLCPRGPSCSTYMYICYCDYSLVGYFCLPDYMLRLGNCKFTTYLVHAFNPYVAYIIGIRLK